MRKQSKKLALQKQQIKVLADTSLVTVQGGGGCPSHEKCPPPAEL